MAKNIYKAQGIVLHTVKYGDNSIVAYLLTDVCGRATYMIQGVHSSRGRGNKAALFQPMFLLEFEGMESEHSQMHRMKEVRNLAPFSSLPFDVRKSTISLFMAEVLYRLVREVEVNAPLFGFVRDSVLELDRMEGGIANFHLWFLVHLSAYMGFYPGNEYSQGDYFDIRDGEFCALPPQHRLCLEPEAASLLGHLMAADPAGLAGIELSRRQRVAFMESILVYFGYHFDAIHSVESINILREVF